MEVAVQRKEPIDVKNEQLLYRYALNLKNAANQVSGSVERAAYSISEQQRKCVECTSEEAEALNELDRSNLELDIHAF